MSYTVQQLAALANISIRTLHYYDEIGLLAPSRIKKNGYREYEDRELLLLQQILLFRELEIPLDEIKQIIHEPKFSPLTALAIHRESILAKRNRLNTILVTIDSTMTHLSNGTQPEPEELYNAFEDPDVAEYQTEVQNRWGNTEAYKQSAARVSKMTKAEMEKLKADGIAHTKAIADAMDLGPSHETVQALIAKSHAGINFFYDCSPEMFRELGEMYVADPRFSAYYEKIRPGLAVFVRDAIRVYVDNMR